jgi:HEAT repeat protein
MKKLDKEFLIREVKQSGVEISNINDLMNINMKYQDLVPILLKHLNDIDDENDKQFIVRCLGVKGFVEASKPLINEFYQSDNMSYKWAIGNSLSIISDTDSVSELIKIAMDKRHGISRQMIVYGFDKFRNDETKTALISLLNDEDVVGHAIHSLSKFKDKTLIKYLEPFLTYKVTWVRNEAKKAVKGLENIK